MTVITVDLQCIVSYRFATQHLDCRLEHLERAGTLVAGLLRLGAMSTRAKGTRAVVTQEWQAKIGVEPILPVDFNPLGF